MLATRLALASAIALGGASCARVAAAQDHAIDTARSVLKLRVFKSGLLSGFAHNHEIEARIAEGTVHLSGDPSVALKVRARELRVQDPGVSAKERGDVQRTMEGPEVLDIERFPGISFQSTAVQKEDDRHWVVRGNLTLHGKTSPVQVDVAYKEGHYQGSAELLQHEFGMTPVSIAGGTVKVKDGVRIEFDVVLKP
jgi:polyisoprenoid-binding protein YceI